MSGHQIEDRSRYVRWNDYGPILRLHREICAHMDTDSVEWHTVLVTEHTGVKRPLNWYVKVEERKP